MTMFYGLALDDVRRGAAVTIATGPDGRMFVYAGLPDAQRVRGGPALDPPPTPKRTKPRRKVRT